jgi:hypothetical protein
MASERRLGTGTLVPLAALTTRPSQNCEAALMRKPPTIPSCDTPSLGLVRRRAWRRPAVQWWDTVEQQGKVRSLTCDRITPTNSTGNASMASNAFLRKRVPLCRLLYFPSENTETEKSEKNV